MADPGTRGAGITGTGFSWRKLLSFAALAMALNILLASVLIFKSADPPFIVMFVLFTAGGVLALRSGKAGVVGTVLASLAALMFGGAGGGFLISLIKTPEAREILPVASGVLLSLTVLVSAIVLAIKGRGRAFEPSNGARALGSLVILLILAVVAWNTLTLSKFDSQEARGEDIRVVTENFEFQPDSLSAGAGTVNVHLTNDDSVLHTFTIEKLGVDVSVPAGKSVRATFEAEAGDYEFVCTPHSPDMAGDLKVT